MKKPNKSSAGPSCCAVPIDEESDQQNQTSIYGNDMTLVPTEVLINKAIIEENYQGALFKGIGYELQPLIIVTSTTEKTKLTFDFSYLDNIIGEYLILNAETGEQVASFTGKKGINEVEFNSKKTGAYAILKDSSLLGVIEVVDDLNSTNIEEIRKKYLN